MPRKLVWVEENRFRGFACSECSWRFDFLVLRPTGKSFDERMRNFELQRDKEFTSHVCANHPRIKSAKRAMQFKLEQSTSLHVRDVRLFMYVAGYFEVLLETLKQIKKPLGKFQDGPHNGETGI
jgi:hypothetical protein